jgi:hypothetical protein
MWRPSPAARLVAVATDQMARSAWLVWLLLSMWLSMLLINPSWIRSDNALSVAWIAILNVILGLTSLVLFVVLVLRTARGAVHADKQIPTVSATGVAPLAAAVVVINAIGFYVCDIRFSMLLAALNVTMPFAWLVSRRIMHETAIRRKGQLEKD